MAGRRCSELYMQLIVPIPGDPLGKEASAILIDHEEKRAGGEEKSQELKMKLD